jgi:hypothetical protein
MEPMSALRAPALRGAVAETAGAAGAAALRAGLRAGFFLAAAFLRADELCFLRVVCGIDSIGATASAAMRTTAKALSLLDDKSYQRALRATLEGTEKQSTPRIAGCRPELQALGKELRFG